MEGEGTGSTGALAAADVNVMFAPVARTQQHLQPVRPGEGGEGWEAESEGASQPQEPMLVFASRYCQPRVASQAMKHEPTDYHYLCY